MSKRGIVGRVAQLAHADVAIVIDAAENPRQAADDLARSYAATIAEAEHAIAQLSESRQIAMDDQRTDTEAAEMWAAAAAATSQTADELRAAGDASAADRFDDLARVALGRELMAENDVEASQHTIEAQTEAEQTLAAGVGQMHSKLSELTNMSQRPEVGSDAKRTRPGREERRAGNVDVMDPASEVALFDDLVRQEQSSLRGGQGQARPSAAQHTFADAGTDSSAANEIEERLQGLKLARAMASALARANDQPFR